MYLRRPQIATNELNRQVSIVNSLLPPINENFQTENEDKLNYNEHVQIDIYNNKNKNEYLFQMKNNYKLEVLNENDENSSSSSSSKLLTISNENFKTLNEKIFKEKTSNNTSIYSFSELDSMCKSAPIASCDSIDIEEWTTISDLNSYTNQNENIANSSKVFTNKKEESKDIDNSNIITTNDKNDNVLNILLKKNLFQIF